MTNMELADKLQKEAEHFSGAKDLVEMLLEAAAALHNLHTENTALRATEDNLRAQIGHGEPVAYLCTGDGIYPADDPYFGIGGGFSGERTPLYTHPAQQQKPLTDEQRKELIKKVAESIDSYSIIMTHWPLVIDAVEAAHNIGEKK